MPAICQLLCAAALLPLAACATIPAEPVAAPAAPPLASTSPAAETPHDRLFRLFAETDEADLANNPISALFRGDMRYADRIGDFLTPQHVATIVLDAVADERCLILPHASVLEMMSQKTSDHERWLRGMRRYQASLLNDPR